MPAIRPLLKVAIPVVLFLGAIVALAGGWRQLIETQIEIQPIPAVAAFAVLLIGGTWASIVWAHMARVFGASFSLRAGARVYLTSNLGKYLPGKVGHVVARIYLAREQGVPLTIGTTAAVVDIVLYLAAALTCAVLALPAFFPFGGRLVSLVAVLAVSVGLALLHPAVLNRVLGGLARRLPGGTAFRLECGYTTILLLFGMYVILIGLTTFGMLLSISALQPLSLGELTRIASIYGVSYLAGVLVPFAPNGIGVREGVMATMLEGSMTVLVAGAASVLFRVLQVGAEALLALIASRL